MKTAWIITGILAMTTLTNPRLAAAATGNFMLEDYLGRTWRNECVQFPLSGSELKSARAGQALLGPDGQEVLYQIVDGASSRNQRIAFLANLDPWETRTYRFGDQPATARSDLAIEETADQIRLVNSVIGISLRKTLPDGAGPVDGIRLGSGRWVGGSRLTGAKDAVYSARVVAQGPVFSEAVCRVETAGQGAWELRFRLLAHEPVVLVSETSTLGDPASFVLALSREFSPDGLLYRTGKGRCGLTSTWKIAPTDGQPVHMLEPWLHWWERDRQGQWFGLYNEAGTDLLMVGAYAGDQWVDLARKETAAITRIPLTQNGAELELTFPLRASARRWMIAALDQDASLEVTRRPNEADRFAAPLPQQYLVKHGVFPLDRIKDYVVRWRGDNDQDRHPCLLVTKDDVAQLKKTFQPDRARLEQLRTQDIVVYQMDDPVIYCLGTGDAALSKRIAETAVKWVQESCDRWLKQDDLVSFGFAPHHSSAVLTTLNLADVIWSSGQLAPELRDRMRKQIAFLGYTLTRPDYWSPAHGLAANPNMTTTVAASYAAIAAFLPSHPRAREWMKLAMAELKDNQLDTWSDANGGWLEAPHYAMVSYDYLLGVFLMTHNARMNRYLYDPKMKKVIEWFAKTSTPPDSRVNGRRHRPPIGNTYLNEPTSAFGTVAYLWRKKDPRFAAEMQWMHQQNNYDAPGIGGFFPTLAGYRKLLLDPAIPAQAPAYGSELFPETGVILRNHFPSERETQLHLIAGKNHAHYDQDSGSITLWGKGRILADDFGYYGCAPGEDHSMVVSPQGPEGGIMDVQAFSTQPRLDYVLGVKQGWTRQIAFLKDPDPLGPNYFVIADALREPGPAIWRLWLTAAAVQPGPQGAKVEGKEDVDLDVFFTAPAQVALSTEEKSRTSGSGFFADGHWGPMESTQTGLIAKAERERGFVAVLYPRMKTDPLVKCQSLAEGRVVKIETPAGTDWVFLSPERFEFAEGEVKFAGTAGTIQQRGGELILSLGAAGRIESAGRVLESKRPATK